MFSFHTDYPLLQDKADAALAGLQANIRTLSPFPKPVLIEGGNYQGIWLESGPLEGLLYADVNPEIALNNHRAFFALQEDDGYLPCFIWNKKVGRSQIQMVVPIAATALELYKKTGDENFLEQAFSSCSRWELWLEKFRDTRQTGLCEAFCEYDTGHDKSPRWDGVPRKCRDDDARLCPEVTGLPYLSPDLSATIYGGRIALAGMAKILGYREKTEYWTAKAETVKKALFECCFDDESLCFYDLDVDGKFNRIACDLLTRVLSEHVVNQSLFEQIYNFWIVNPKAFWTPFPFPSVAINDPRFVQELPDNSWGGPSQVLTALRAPRWLEYYGKYAKLTELMHIWIEALINSNGFMQQMNPFTGKLSCSDGYSPAMCLLIDFIKRLYGISIQDQEIEWNCRCPNQQNSSYKTEYKTLDLEIINQKNQSHIVIDGINHISIAGECRFVTDFAGNPKAFIGTSTEQQIIKLKTRHKTCEYQLAVDQKMNLT
ncbi:MAG: hypothetical protein A2X48_12960 [Lentisphaerae bacterium GWF2_49_21]|nr:MAG: hypothetical protein A2X48_12960 [Lentisphaerae bacterium GWF2_49_21]